MTWTRAAKSTVIVTAVVSVLCASALAMGRGQTVATLLDRFHDLTTPAGFHAAARREVIEHVEYVVDEIVRKALTQGPQ